MKFVILYFVCGFFWMIYMEHLQFKAGLVDKWIQDIWPTQKNKFKDYEECKNFVYKWMFWAGGIVYWLTWPYWVVALIHDYVKGTRYFD